MIDFPGLEIIIIASSGGFPNTDAEVWIRLRLDKGGVYGGPAHTPRMRRGEGGVSVRGTADPDTAPTERDLRAGGGENSERERERERDGWC